MTTVIKGGTIVTHDLTYAADVLIEGGTITAIGPDLSGDTVIDADFRGGSALAWTFFTWLVRTALRWPGRSPSRCRGWRTWRCCRWARSRWARRVLSRTPGRSR